MGKDREAELDREILAGIAQGREEAFVRLVERYQRRVFTLAARVLDDPEDAEDMAQEVFLKIYKGAARFRGGSSVSTWVYRITLNACINRKSWWKRRFRDRWVSLETPRNPDGRSMADVLPGRGKSPQEEAERDQFRGRFQEALRTLPQEFRAAVVLRDQEGLPYEEIAALLSVSLGTVKSRISRGRRLLREQLAPLLSPSAPGREP